MVFPSTTFSAFELWLRAPGDDDSSPNDAGLGHARRRAVSSAIPEANETPRATIDAALIERIRVGDMAAFEDVFRNYYDPLVAFVRTIVRSEDIAADVVDDLFTTMWVRRDQLDIQTSVASYLYRSVRNGALNILRNRRTQDALHAHWLPSETTSTQELASAAVEREELSRVIERLLATLPERRREAVTLRWKGELSHAEIAQVLGITVQSVANLINRALHDLRQRLPDDFA